MRQTNTWQWVDQTITINQSRNENIYYYCKRVMDLVLAVILLVLLAPVMVLITILIKLDSSGPIFFVQERVGAKRRSGNGQTVWEIHTFACYKFRSMVKNADPSLHQAHIKAYVEGRVDTLAGDEAKFKLKNDPRITRIGKLLRKTSLDELPQLFNVLKGEMSLVGPRPVPTYEVAEYHPWHYERLTTLPGLTGPWQIHGRGEVTFDEMIQMDIEYVRNASLWLDIKTLFLTVPAVLSGRGAA